MKNLEMKEILEAKNVMNLEMKNVTILEETKNKEITIIEIVS